MINFNTQNDRFLPELTVNACGDADLKKGIALAKKNNIYAFKVQMSNGKKALLNPSSLAKYTGIYQAQLCTMTEQQRGQAIENATQSKINNRDISQLQLTLVTPAPTEQPAVTPAAVEAKKPKSTSLRLIALGTAIAAGTVLPAILSIWSSMQTLETTYPKGSMGPFNCAPEPLAQTHGNFKGNFCPTRY